MDLKKNRQGEAVCRIRNSDSDPDSSFHFDSDSNPAPNFTTNYFVRHAKNSKSNFQIKIIHLLVLFIRHMRHVYCGCGSLHQFGFCRIRIRHTGLCAELFSNAQVPRRFCRLAQPHLSPMINRNPGIAWPFFIVQYSGDVLAILAYSIVSLKQKKIQVKII